MTLPNGPPPPIPDWAHDTPRPTPPPPPRRMMYIASKAGEIHAGLCVLRDAIQQLKQAGASSEEIRQVFWAEMTPSWDEATE